MKIKRNITFLCVLLIVCVTPANSSDLFVIDENLGQLKFGKQIHFIEDHNRSLRFKDILGKKLNWEKSPADSFNFGFVTSVFWMKFSFENKLEGSQGWLSLIHI